MNSSDDKLSELLSHFELRARVFQSGPLCHSAVYDQADGLGYIHLQQSGRLKIESPDQNALIIDQPGLIFYLSPKTHRLIPLDDQVSMLCASFEFGKGIQTPLLYALPHVITLGLGELSQLNQLLDVLFSEAKQQHSGRQVILDRLIEVIIVCILRELIHHRRVKVGLLAGLADPKLYLAFRAIHQDPAYAWNLENLAQQAGMSRARFAAKFHQVVGMTPGHYLTQWRLSLAQSLLCRDKPLSYIADEVGYANSSALSRAFRAQFGTTPKAWLRVFKS